MAYTRSTGLAQVTVIPTDAPTTNGPRFVQIGESNNFAYWDGADWNAITLGDTTTLVYQAIIAQSGAGTPTATILENTLGEVPTFAKNGVGDYELNTVAGIFLPLKTFVHATISPGSTAAIVRAGTGIAVTDVAFKTFDAADVAAELVGTMSLTILVFP